MDDKNLQSASSPQVSSFMARATNVFASPGELYTEVASTPTQTSSWLIPFLISIVLVLIITFAIFNNPSLRQQVNEIQSAALQKAVNQGKITQEMADTRREQMENSGLGMFMLFGGGIASVQVAFAFFVAGLVMWLATKFGFKSSAGYTKVLEVYGLAGLIGVFGGIITAILMNLFDTVHASPGAGLLVMSSFDPENTSHRILASLNLFTIWQVSIVGIGLGKLAGKSTGSGMGLAFGLWGIWVVVSSLLGLGFR